MPRRGEVRRARPCARRGGSSGGLPRGSPMGQAPKRAFRLATACVALAALAEDRDGSLWIGTYGGGLTRMRDGAFTALTAKEGLPSDIVRTLYADRSGALWVGTDGSGLARVEGGNGVNDCETLSTRPRRGAVRERRPDRQHDARVHSGDRIRHRRRAESLRGRRRRRGGQPVRAGLGHLRSVRLHHALRDRSRATMGAFPAACIRQAGGSMLTGGRPLRAS